MFFCETRNWTNDGDEVQTRVSPRDSHNVTQASPDSTGLVQKTQGAAQAVAHASILRLRDQAIRGTLWTMFGYGSSQVFRLIGNIIVARLLFPEAFGIMGIVFAVMTGLTMFSDIGLGPSVIQHPRGEDRSFLRTAWTLQVGRGVSIWLLSALLAWPVYWLNKEPLLLWLIPIAGFTAVLSGFNSLSLFTYKRRLHFGRVTLLHVFAHFAGAVAMITWAWYRPTVWALLAHAFVSTGVMFIGSFVFVPETPMGFQWEPGAARDLVRFGRWIFIGTALTFLVSRLDIFILGGLVGMGALGVYTVAKNYSRAAIDALMALTTTVLFPVYSRLAERGTEALRTQTVKMRAGLLALFLPPLWALAVGGHYLIAFLYDDRYQDAAWILRILAAGAVGAAIASTIEPVLLAKGDSFRHMLQLASRLALQIAGMALGAHLAGVRGFIIGLAAADVINYPVVVALVRKYGVWLPVVDGIAYGASVLVIGLGWLLL